MITGSAAPALPSFLLFYFRVCAFSILSQCISRGLQQARNVIKTWCLILQVVQKKKKLEKRRLPVICIKLLITRTFSDFPWRFELSGVDYICFLQYQLQFFTSIFIELSRKIASAKKKKLQNRSTTKSFPWSALRRRSNSIPWCTTFHVMLSLPRWHIMISNLQYARNERRSAPCGWFPNMFRFSSFCFREYPVSLYSPCFKGEFQRHFEGF